MLTDTAIKNAKPGNKPYRLADEKGLYLEVKPNGRKYFRMKYRFAGKEKLLAFGAYPETTLKDEVAGLCEDTKGPLFRTIGRGTGQLTLTPLTQPDAHAMIQRRVAGAGITTKAGNHSFRATGITAYLKNGGSLEKAAAMANHASTRTTQLYDRRCDEMTLDEVEKIGI